MSYNEWGYNPYDKPDYGSHPNSDGITSGDDTGDGVVGGYYWDRGRWSSLPDDRDDDSGRSRFDDGMPRLSDFDSYEEWEEAYDKAKAEREAKKQAAIEAAERIATTARAKAERWAPWRAAWGWLCNWVPVAVIVVLAGVFLWAVVGGVGEWVRLR